MSLEIQWSVIQTGRVFETLVSWNLISDALTVVQPGWYFDIYFPMFSRCSKVFWRIDLCRSLSHVIPPRSQAAPQKSQRSAWTFFIPDTVDATKILSCSPKVTQIDICIYIYVYTYNAYFIFRERDRENYADHHWEPVKNDLLRCWFSCHLHIWLFP